MATTMLILNKLYRNKYGFIGIYLILSSLIAILPGCKTTDMSVQAAQDIALEFKGTYKAVPPRGLGVTIERKVAFYKDAPNVPAEFLKPQKKYSESELEALFSGSNKGGWEATDFYREMAYDQFMLGNLSLAIKAIDLAIERTKYKNRKIRAYSCKAIFLAAAGDYPSAERAFEAASTLSSEWDSWVVGANKVSEPYVLYTRIFQTKAKAAIYFARNDIVQAEKEYQQLIADIAKYRGRMRGYGTPAFHEPEARVNLAKVLLTQGRSTEAEIYVREAIRWGHNSAMPDAFITLSRIFFDQGRFNDAVVCARTALHIAMALRAPIDAYIRARAREAYARALFAAGRYNEALAQYNQIENDLVTDQETFNRRFKGNSEWGLVLLMNGDSKRAVEKFDFAIEQGKETFGADAYTLAELGAMRAMALVQLGQTDAALKAFDVHIPLLLQNWRAKNGAGTSQNAITIKLKLIFEAYMAALTETGNPVYTEKSLLLANTMQGQLIGRAVAMSSARSAVKDPELASLIRQRQDLELKLTAFKNQLANSLYAPPELINTEVVIELRHQITTLNQALIALEKEIQIRYPEYANIINPPDVSVSEIQKTLDGREALVSIFSGSKFTFIWAIPKQGPVALAKVPLSSREMTAIVEKLRKALNPGDASTSVEIPPFDLKLAYNLYAKVLKPVESGWKDAKDLLVVAQGPIGQIPLAILPTTPIFKTKADHGKLPFSNYRAVDWLIKNHSVTVLPSIAALINLRSIIPKSGEMQTYAGFGDPYFNLGQQAEAKDEANQQATLLAMRNAPIQMRGIRVTHAGKLDKKEIASIDIGMLNRLPDTREEVINIAATLKADPEKDVFIGEQASERTVKSIDLSNRRVVVFATHGLVPGDLDGLDQPALALSAPDVTGDNENDGLLTMGEIMGLNLNADWVVLSACNTGAAEGEGAEAVSGLGQAFFYAGARSLLVTGWPVETVSAKLLTTDLFQRQLLDPNTNRAEALQATMNAMMFKNHSQGFSYAHPIFWAPYAIVGDGRR